MSEMTTHPAADLLPMQTEDEFAALVELIAEHGQQRPIVVDDQGRIVDGRNRWKACRVLGIDPVTEPLGDRDPWQLSEDENGANRSLSTGQKAMRRALTLAAQGRRRDGRWERNAVSQTSDLSDAWRVAMGQAGLVVDVAARAQALNPDDGRISVEDRDYYAGLPALVLTGEATITYAHKKAQEFDNLAALAEIAAYRPLTDPLMHLQQIAEDIQRHMPLPTVAIALKKEHRDLINDIAKQLAAAAKDLREHAKEAK